MRKAGTVLHGMFTLVEPLGRGGEGETWRATDASGADVCLKLLRLDSSTDRKNLLQEASTLRGIDHPHVVRYLGVIDLPGAETCLVMDYIAGGDLAAWLRERNPGGLEASEAAKLMLQVADALVALHAERIIHRDLKPSNILVADADAATPDLRVADFGIARTVADGTRTTTHGAGSPGYMAPEQEKYGAIGFAVDVFALGGIGWTLLTGTRPPDAGAEPSFPRHDARAQALIRLIRRMRAREPEQRVTLAAARSTLEPIADPTATIADDLGESSNTLGADQFTGSRPVQPTPSTMSRSELPAPPPPPPPQGLALPLAVGAGLVAIALAILAVGWSWTTTPAAPAAVATTPPASAPIPASPAPIPPPVVPPTAAAPPPLVVTQTVPAPPPLPPTPEKMLPPPIPTKIAPARAAAPPRSWPTGTLTVTVLGTPPDGVRVLVDGGEVPCVGCTGNVVLAAAAIAVGDHQVVCVGAAGRDAAPIDFALREGEQERIVCSPSR
jgi:serine/threonine protein kinase